MTFFYVLFSLFFLSVIIFVHEWFHLLAAKLLKIHATEFAVGFGPAFFGYQKHANGHRFKWFPKKKDPALDADTLTYYVRIIPLGGYVSFGKEKDGVMEDGLAKHPPWKRIIVAFFGPLGNFIFATFLMALFLFYTTSGLQIGDIEKGSIFDKIGFQEQMILKKVNGSSVSTYEDVTKNLLAGADKTCFEVIDHGKGTFTTCSPRPFTEVEIKHLSLLETNDVVTMKNVLPKSVELVSIFTLEYIKVLAEVMFNLDIEQMSGPVGIVDYMQKHIIDFYLFLQILILFNIAIAVANLIFPLSITDGGRILLDFIAILLRKHKLNTKALDLFSVFIILLLFVTITYFDVIKLFVS